MSARFANHYLFPTGYPQQSLKRLTPQHFSLAPLLSGFEPFADEVVQRDWIRLCYNLQWLHLAQTHLITSTSGSSLTGSFSFGGSLASDGTFDFDSSGNPLSGVSTVVTLGTTTPYSVSSSGSLTGTFEMGEIFPNGTYPFNSSGEPMSSASFTWTDGSSTGLPNQVGEYRASDGVVTSLNYRSGGGSSGNVVFALDGTYGTEEEGGEGFQFDETGTYTLSAGTPFPENTPAFTTQPNENDNYNVTGGILTAIKYDASVNEYQLNFHTDGTFSLSDPVSLEEFGSGTYAITAVPEPSSWALVAGVLAISGALFRRRRTLSHRH